MVSYNETRRISLSVDIYAHHIFSLARFQWHKDREDLFRA